MGRPGRALVALLLLGSAGLTAVATWLRWASVCPLGGDWDGAACQARQDHAFDFVPVAAPWRGDPSWSVLGGAGLALFAVAVLLLPLAVSCRRWQRSVLVLPGLSGVLVGGTAVLAGVRGRVVEVPVHAIAVYLLVLVLPVALLLLSGQGRGLLVAALVLATPLPQALLVQVLVPYSSYDTAPWTEMVVVPFLLVAAVTLRPWEPSAQRSFSNQQRAHTLSL